MFFQILRKIREAYEDRKERKSSQNRAVAGTTTLNALVAAGASLAAVGFAAISTIGITASDTTVAAFLPRAGAVRAAAGVGDVPDADIDASSIAHTTSSATNNDITADTPTNRTAADTPPDAPASPGSTLRPFDAEAIADAVAEGVAEAVIVVVTDNFPASIADAVTDAVSQRVADAVAGAITDVTRRLSSASTLAASPPIIEDNIWDNF